MRRCKICVTPENFPHVKFNDDGVCSVCAAQPTRRQTEHLMRKYKARFDSLVKRFAGRGAYDILVCFSGGKDSAYALSIFRERYRLKVLAFTFDNGFIPPGTYANIRRVVETLGVDHILFRPRFDILKKIFVNASRGRSYFPAKSMERAGAICASCISLMKYTSLKLAIEKEVPFMGFGWSPGQAPVASSILELAPEMVRKMEAVSRRALEKAAGRRLDEYFLEERHYLKKGRFPILVHPLAFLGYDEEKMKAKLKSLGWRRPKGVDINASNCLLNSYANEVHIKRYGFHPYIVEAAELVRVGCISRRKGLGMVTYTGPAATIAAVKKKLGV